MANKQPRLVFAVLKGSGLFPFLLGSSRSWADATPSPRHAATGRLKTSKPQPAAYWRLWSIVADDPADVHAAGDAPAQCYRRAMLGGLPSTDVSPAEAQEFARVARLRLGVHAAVPACRRLRVTVVQRAVRYAIRNLDAVVADLQRWRPTAPATPPWDVAVQVVSFENMTVAAQVEVAADTDVLVGVHGNGLSWSMAMPAAGMLLELWPNRAYNRNYVDFALRYNLAYFAVEARQDGCRARCPAAYDLAKSGVMARMSEHWSRVVCRGKAFNTTREFYRIRDAAAKEKAADRRSR